MKIGKFISNYRKNNNVTQENFAKDAGLSRSYIARLERGDYKDGAISLATFIRLSNALEIPVHKFFKEIEKLKS